MPCYWPVPAFQGMPGEALRLMPPVGTANLAVPCGRCLGCRTDRAADWARRATHEASLWPVTSFVTLTYDDDHLPVGGHLVPKDLQDFLKRLRIHAHRHSRSVDGDRGAGVRYLACGEYGDRTQRPHYHAILFNAGFRDAYPVGKDMAESPLLAKLWPFGSNRVSEFTPARANYVAQYTLKKIGQSDCDADGVVRPAPFLRVSTRPGIGAPWLSRFREDLAHGYLVADGRKASVPRAYLRRLREESPQLADTVQARAEATRVAVGSDRNDPARLRAAELIHQRRKALSESRAL
uniref:Putative replication protein VP4 n=1 Tax=uncultured virus TaxID=340016 RepID=A0A1D8MK80_9VIRU|nr:putative replication protein VP4 [uncultured virus]